MKVLVIGAGVIGVTTAYQLVKDGHEVVVLERLGEAADETSFGIVPKLCVHGRSGPST